MIMLLLLQTILTREIESYLYDFKFREVKNVFVFTK